MTRWLQPRLLALHLLAIVVLAACVLMGLWQLGVYGAKHEDESAAVRARKPVPLLAVWGPDDPLRADLVGRRVRIQGRADSEFTVKRPNGESWLATTVRVKGTNAAIVVVLGPSPKTGEDVPTLPPSFTGILQPGEATGDLSIAHRVNEYHGDLFSGYALLDDPRYPFLDHIEPPDPHVSWTVGLRNLAYALQWWVFGLFAVFMWWRMVTDAQVVDMDEADNLSR